MNHPPGYGPPQQPGYGPPQTPGYSPPQQPGYGAPQQHPGYGPPPGPQAWQSNSGPAGFAQPQEKNATAATAMKLGVGSILCAFAAPFALYFGLKAQKEIAAQPGRYSNAGNATTGIVLGGILSSIFALAFLNAIVRSASADHGGARATSSDTGVSAAQVSTPATPLRATETVPSRPTSAASGNESLPWISQVQANCSAYRAAPNEIKKSAVFRSNNATLSGAKVFGVRGKLTELTTSQGGDSLRLTITVGDVEFQTSPLDSIAQGSATYNAAADLATGQCVVFSATQLSSSSVLEQSKVCDTEYFARFTSLSRCP